MTCTISSENAVHVSFDNLSLVFVQKQPCTVSGHNFIVSIVYNTHSGSLTTPCLLYRAFRILAAAHRVSLNGGILCKQKSHGCILKCLKTNHSFFTGIFLYFVFL